MIVTGKQITVHQFELHVSYENKLIHIGKIWPLKLPSTTSVTIQNTYTTGAKCENLISLKMHILQM